MPGIKTTPTRQVVVREIPRPISPLQVFNAVQKQQNCAFLDSALHKEGLSRYSFICYQPFLTLKTKGTRVEIQTNKNTVRKNANPFTTLRRLLKRFRLETNGPPVPFIGGAVGYLSYDLCHFIEKLPTTNTDDIGFPEMYFGFYDTVIAFDHVLDKCYIVAVGFGEDCQPYIHEDRTPAHKRVDEIMECINRVNANTQRHGRGTPHIIKSNFTPEEYMRVVRRAKEYIAAGDIYQVNLSQRFKTRIHVPPHELYLKLREVNPAPFACYLKFDDMAVVSSSPERFLRVNKGHVQTRPIKGTRPRGCDERTDLQMKQELLSSPKENAELTMIVDLERNDLGRVCNYSSIKVVQNRVLESYPTVHHLVATVEGDLHPRYDIIDLIKATFPGGSITGAPKIRAMQIIDELEPVRRSVYTGAIGYIGFNDCVDLNIAIRTFLVKGSEAYFQVGGGIVADSDEEKEYEETLHKAKALIASLES